MSGFLRLQVPMAAVVAGFSIGVSRHILPVVFPSMQSIAGIMNYQLGLLTSAYYFSYMLFALLFGSLSDHLNGRFIIIACCFLISVGCLGMGISNSSISLLAFSILSGIGAGGLYVPMVSLLLKKFISKRGFVASLVLTGEGISGIMIGIIIPLIVSSLGWRHVWWLFGLMATFFGFYLWLTIEDTPPEPNASFGSSLNPTILRKMKSKDLWILGSIYFFHAITRGVFVTFAVAYLFRSGWSLTHASTAFSFIAIGFIPGASLTGVLVDRFNNRSVLMALLFLQIICVSLFLFNLSYAAILFLSFSEGFCIAGIPTIMGILPTHYFTKDTYGRVLGFLTLSFGLGVSISPLAGGWFGDATNSLSSPLLLGLAASFVSLGITFFILKPRVSL
jgi:MFS family permease